MPTRKEVYEAIDQERDYQDSLPRNVVKNQRPMEHLAIIRHLVTQMEADWYKNPGQPNGDSIRKIAAVAVRCMEENGVRHRKWKP